MSAGGKYLTRRRCEKCGENGVYLLGVAWHDCTMSVYYGLACVWIVNSPYYKHFRRSSEVATLLAMRAKRWISWVGLTVIGCGLVVFEISEASFGMGAAGVIGLALLTAIIIFLVGTVIGIGSGRWRVAGTSGAIVLTIIASSWVAGRITERQRQASMAAARPIIAAAEQYHGINGVYPASLQELIPTYLPSEPRTRMGLTGTQFHLAPDAWGGFGISFECPAFMVCYYESESKAWFYDD